MPHRVFRLKRCGKSCHRIPQRDHDSSFDVGGVLRALHFVTHLHLAEQRKGGDRQDLVRRHSSATLYFEYDQP